MRKHSKVILLAEEQLVFGHTLSEMMVARDNLRIAVPGCLLLELLDARIARRRREHRLSPQARGQRKEPPTKSEAGDDVRGRQSTKR
jgi:hypothetical protein